VSTSKRISIQNVRTVVQGWRDDAYANAVGSLADQYDAQLRACDALLEALPMGETIEPAVLRGIVEGVAKVHEHVAVRDMLGILLADIYLAENGKWSLLTA
jgi:hypothetical protein